MASKKVPGEKIGLAGFYRLNITQDGRIVGDSGWRHNLFVSAGLDNGLAQVLLGGGGSSRVGFAALGTGAAPGTAATYLPGELVQTVNARKAVSTATATSSSAAAVTARYYGVFASSVSFILSSASIQNIGLYNASGTGGSNLISGASYGTSALATNQDVNFTYEWRFATA